MPDLKDHSSRVFVSLSAVHLCSPVGSMRCSGTWNLPAAFAYAFCFQSLLAAMLAAFFYVPGLLFKGMEKDCEAAFEGTSSFVHSGPWEAQHKVQPVQFFVKKGRSACQRPLSEDVWRTFCRKSLARMVCMCMP